MDLNLAINIFKQNPETHVNTLNTSRTGIAIVTCSASASVIGSSMIILLILRSDRKLTKVYHRIMFGMSFFDLLQSIFISLSTLLMPKNMIYDQFDGIVAGTTGTCDMQGFMIIFASFCTLLFNPILCIYYLCSIRFKIKDDRFSRVIEPVMYFTVIAFCLIVTTAGLLYGQFNPSPTTYPWCGISRYPWWCTEDLTECAYERGDYEKSVPMLKAGNAAVVLGAMVVIVSMIAVTLHIYCQERMLKAIAYSSLTDRDQNRFRLYKKNMMYTKDAVISALLYTVVFFTVWHYPFIRIFRGNANEVRAEQVLRLIFRPSQGFFNLIIFIYHKVRNIKTHCPNISVREAFFKAFGHESEPEYIVSNLTMVRRNQQLDRLHFAFGDDDDDDDDDDDESITSLEPVLQSVEMQTFERNAASLVPDVDSAGAPDNSESEDGGSTSNSPSMASSNMFALSSANESMASNNPNHVGGRYYFRRMESQ